MWLSHKQLNVLGWHEPQQVVLKRIVVWVPVTWRTVPIGWEQEEWDAEETECVLDPNLEPPKLFHNKCK